MAAAQPKPAITPADYGKWEALAIPSFRPTASGWRRRSGGRMALRSCGSTRLRAAAAKVAAFGGAPEFSAIRAGWRTPIGMSDADEDKLKKAKKPVQNKLGIMDLTSGTTIERRRRAELRVLRSRHVPRVPAISADAQHAARGERSARRSRGRAADGAQPRHRRRHHVRQRDQLRVAGEGDAPGDDDRRGGPRRQRLQLYDPAKGELKVLDSGNAVFSALAWRKESSDLAALRSVKNKDYEGESYTVLAWKDLGAKKVGEAAAAKRIVGRARRSGARTDARSLSASPDWDKKIDGAKSDDDPSNVEVWHPKDVNVISEQKLRVARDRDRQRGGGLARGGESHRAAGNECQGDDAVAAARGRARWRWMKLRTMRPACSGGISWTYIRWIWRPARAPRWRPGLCRRCGAVRAAITR